MPLALIGLVCPTHIAVLLQRSTSTTSCWSAPMLECSSRNSNNSFVCAENFEGAWYGRCSSTCTDNLPFYRSVIIAKLTNASSAWCGFTSATDRQKINAFIRRSQQNQLLPPYLPLFAELCRAADDKLFQRVTTDRKHILHDLIPLPSVASQYYNLCQRRHNLELPSKSGHLRDCNFIQCYS